MTEQAPRDSQVVARILQRAGELERTAARPHDRVSPIAEASMLAAAEEVGLSADETAAALSMTAGAVRVAQHRALAKLRTMLQSDTGLWEQVI